MLCGSPFSTLSATMRCKETQTNIRKINHWIRRYRLRNCEHSSREGMGLNTLPGRLLTTSVGSRDTLTHWGATCQSGRLSISFRTLPHCLTLSLSLCLSLSHFDSLLFVCLILTHSHFVSLSHSHFVSLSLSLPHARHTLISHTRVGLHTPEPA